MSEEAIRDVSEALLSASLPIDQSLSESAAERAIRFYMDAPEGVALPEEEVSPRFSEMWGLWFSGSSRPSRELRDVVREAISVDPGMERLAGEYFRLVDKLMEQAYMSREYAVALVGCAPLIRTLVSEQHLGLDRIRSVLNVPGATFDAIKSVLSSIGIPAAFNVDDIISISTSDADDVAGYFGDTIPDEADETFRGLLGKFPRSEEFYDNVTELVYIGFEPYLFILYYELLTLETTDRFPGRAVYECVPRSSKVKALWNRMYNPTQENPYLNNAKSVYSLDEAWAETKLSLQTQNGSVLLAGIFDVMSELPYSTRRRIAHVTRCFLVLKASGSQKSTPIAPAGAAEIEAFVNRVSASNSLTKGVLDQRLVDFLTMCVHDEDHWVARGLGSSVNESNAAGRKFGDVEYLDMETRTHIKAYEAHGGGLRDEYVEDHIHSLDGTVAYYLNAAADRGEEYRRDVDVTYVAHDVSRLVKYRSGHEEMICGVQFTFNFVTFDQLLEVAGGIERVSGMRTVYDELVHRRISRLPDSYSLKKRYLEVIAPIE